MQPRDEKLWRIAKRRAHFQRDLMSYLFTNTILITLWYLTSGTKSHFWPGWVLVFWGIGLVTQYYRAYIRPHDDDLAEQEYQKLLKEKQNGL